eukprot:CAMPEP_0114238424 /NCGR_PEP_ID=MMETSP0058-20121206/7917_1 /TAXON_ID=36894 /ORGANISM="Pyramimonas parkeae, CCMP726" /LENGTH=685 /DNA_ID=CAMNT_0001350533 /DNA_START=428 /DNA_END=2485 /DNA_ORIENTATION=+
MLQLKSECATPQFTATRKSPSTIRALSATPVSRQLVAHRRIRPENPLRWMQTVCIGTGSVSVVRKKELRSSKLRVTAPAPTIERYDFLVIGSGIAGLSYALQVADYGRVAVITKDEANEGSTRYAQGGICAVLDPLDSVESHARDTMVAGDFLCDEKVVQLVCSEGAEAVLDLVAMGAKFDKAQDGGLHLTREGGHEHKRIVHAADLTGAEIERTLLAKVRSHSNIFLYENHFATDLVTDQVERARHCLGCDAFDRNTGREVRFLAPATLLAAGGSGHIYPSTTNPLVATGDGVAMAARAGAVISNMEFMQFHPTSLYVPEAEATPACGGKRRSSVFLISEAVRGEGGVLLNGAGERFMQQYDERLELAPRDVVARSIDHQCKLRGEECAFLDVSHLPRQALLTHFPNIARECLSHGIDITSQPIPVTPAMHYTCGGVRAGANAQTSLPGLFACGEAACTGLHGANRLASNSLLEGLVFGRKAAEAARAYVRDEATRGVLAERCAQAATSREVRRPWISSEDACDAAREAAVGAALEELRSALQQAMWDHAGIVRNTRGLLEGLRSIQQIGEAVTAIPVKGLSAELTADWYELANLLTVAELVATSALMRKESRGLHYTLDYPNKSESERRPTHITSTLKVAQRLDVVHAPKRRMRRSVILSPLLDVETTPRVEFKDKAVELIRK